jgi:hypothetical protein
MTAITYRWYPTRDRVRTSGGNMDRETRRFVLGSAVGLGAALFAHYELVTHHRYMREETRGSKEENRKRNTQPDEPQPRQH